MRRRLTGRHAADLSSPINSSEDSSEQAIEKLLAKSERAEVRRNYRHAPKDTLALFDHACCGGLE